MGRLNRPAMDTHVSVEIRKIENGFLVRHSESGPKGYKSREVYHAEKPNLVGAAVKEQGPKPKAEPKKAAQPGTSALKKAAGAGKRK